MASNKLIIIVNYPPGEENAIIATELLDKLVPIYKKIAELRQTHSDWNVIFIKPSRSIFVYDD